MPNQNQNAEQPMTPEQRMAALENMVMNLQSIVKEMERGEQAKSGRIAELVCQRDQFERGYNFLMEKLKAMEEAVNFAKVEKAPDENVAEAIPAAAPAPVAPAPTAEADPL